MASTWGSSWGTSWANSWGAIAAATASAVDVGGKRRRHREDEALDLYLLSKRQKKLQEKQRERQYELPPVEEITPPPPEPVYEIYTPDFNALQEMRQQDLRAINELHGDIKLLGLLRESELKRLRNEDDAEVLLLLSQ